jgi:hypothetical protein
MDVIAIADIKPILVAVPPDRVLDEPWKALRKSRIELPCIDVLRNGSNDLCAAVRPVTSVP